jgi:hypothetical protein
MAKTIVMPIPMSVLVTISLKIFFIILLPPAYIITSEVT